MELCSHAVPTPPAPEAAEKNPPTTAVASGGHPSSDHISMTSFQRPPNNASTDGFPTSESVLQIGETFDSAELDDVSENDSAKRVSIDAQHADSIGDGIV